MNRNTLLFFGAIIASAVAAFIFYKSFLVPLNYVFGPITGFEGLYFSEYLRLRIAVFDFAFVCFLALFLAVMSHWKITLRYWAYGYLLLMVVSLIEAGIYIPDPLRLLFILVSASVGFLLGQAIRFIILRMTGSNRFAVDHQASHLSQTQSARGLDRFIPAKYDLKILALSAVASTAIGLAFHKQLFSLLDYLLRSMGGGFYTLDSPPYPSIQLIHATLDLSFALFLAILLSLFLPWKRAMRSWLIGYAAFVAMSAIFYDGVFTPNRLQLPLIVVLGLIGLLIGQGIRYLLVRFNIMK